MSQHNWATHFFTLSITEGTIEKVSQFIRLLKSACNKNLCFDDQKTYFWLYQKVLNKIKVLNLHYCL